MALLSGIQVISLVGPQGSGKSTLGKLLADRWGVAHVEASTIVRQVVGANIARADMPRTNERTKTEPTWLGDAIARHILSYTDDDVVILTGVREKEVHQTLRELGASIVVIRLAAPLETRFERQLQCGKCGSLAEFKQHDANELSIGMKAVLNEAGWNVVYNNFDTVPAEVVDEIVNLLDNNKEA